MIFRIDKTFTGKLSSQERSEFYCDIIGHGHYADCDDDVRDLFYADIEANGSKIQRDMAKKDPSLKLNNRMRTFLTTIDAGQFTKDQLKLLTCRQAKLMVENEGYERPVYENMIAAYAKSDRKYRNMFIKLNQALSDGMLTFQNGGGHGNYVSLWSRLTSVTTATWLTGNSVRWLTGILKTIKISMPTKTPFSVTCVAVTTLHFATRTSIHCRKRLVFGTCGIAGR